MNKLYNKIDSKIIEQAIEKFENEIDFEFIPVISEKSSYVEHIQWIISLFLLLFFVGTIDFFFQDSYASKIPYFIGAPFLAKLLGSLLDKSDLVDRFLYPKQSSSAKFITRPKEYSLKRNYTNPSLRMHCCYLFLF